MIKIVWRSKGRSLEIEVPTALVLCVVTTMTTMTHLPII